MPRETLAITPATRKGAWGAVACFAIKQQLWKLTVSAEFVREGAPVLLSTASGCGLSRGGCWIGDNLSEPRFVLLNLLLIELRKRARDEGAQPRTAHLVESQSAAKVDKIKNAMHFRTCACSRPERSPARRVAKPRSSTLAVVCPALPQNGLGLAEMESLLARRRFHRRNSRRRARCDTSPSSRGHSQSLQSVRSYVPPFSPPCKSLCLDFFPSQTPSRTSPPSTPPSQISQRTQLRPHHASSHPDIFPRRSQSSQESELILGVLLLAGYDPHEFRCVFIPLRSAFSL